MKAIEAIALTTFRESIRSKILYVVIVFAVIMVLVSTFFGAVTIGDQVIVIKDFGLFSVSLMSVAFAVISGSSLLSKELNRKTIYNILAKPVNRWEFLLGKYLGMLMTITLLIALMGIALSAFVVIFEQRLDVLMLRAYMFIWLELIIVCAAVIFFSSIVVTPMLNGLFTFGVFLAGRSIDYLMYYLSAAETPSLLAIVLKGMNAVLPHLSALNVSNEVVYGNVAVVSLSRMMWSFLYALGYSSILLVFANWIFKKREFN